MKTLTVVAPAYNEEEGVAAFYEAVSAELKKFSGRYKTGMLFVVDGGMDRTFTILKDIASADPSVRIARFSRNFGHQMALLAGLDHAPGDVVITMDADLQHPPSVIPALIAEYEKGNDIVVTIRRDSEGASFLRRTAGALFYRLLRIISDVPMNEHAADFRLMSRRAVDVLKGDIHERALYLRGMVSWMGFRQASITFTAKKRTAGKSKYSLGKLIGFALLGVVSFSKKPLRFATAVGFLFACFGFLFTIAALVQYFSGTPLPPGWATVIVLVSVLGGIQLMFLGVIGEYIGVIFDEVKARPRYIIEETVNL